MKTRDVPQDESILGEHRRATYAQDDQGQYTIVASKGWEVEKVVNSQAVEAVQAEIEAMRQRALRGEVSPLAYHMSRCHMTPALLAANSGIWRWRVNRHLTPAGFAGLGAKVLQRYASALGIDIETLRMIPQD